MSSNVFKNSESLKKKCFSKYGKNEFCSIKYVFLSTYPKFHNDIKDRTYSRARFKITRNLINNSHTVIQSNETK